MNSPAWPRQPAPLHILADGLVLRPVPGDEHLLRGLCPNRCGPMVAAAGGQRCGGCGYFTNVAVASPPAGAGAA